MISQHESENLLEKNHETVIVVEMELTKDEIKSWVDSPGRGREWLAEQCGGVSVRTVNNWLSSGISIPSKALRIIENLMRAEQMTMRAPLPEISQVTLRITTDELNNWSRAFKESSSETIEDWALNAIRAAYLAATDEVLAAESNQTGSLHTPDPVDFGDAGNVTSGDNPSSPGAAESKTA